MWRKGVAFHASSSHLGKKAIESMRELNCIYTLFGSDHHFLGVLSNLSELKGNNIFCIRWLEGACCKRRIVEINTVFSLLKK